MLQNLLSDPERLDAVQRSGMMSSPPQAVFDMVTAALCVRLAVPMALMTIVDDRQQYFKSMQGLSDEMQSIRMTTLDLSMCQNVVKERRLILINDVSIDVLYRGHPGMLNINAVAYLGTPLFLDDIIIGSVCVLDSRPRNWSEADIDFLENRAEFLKEQVRNVAAG